MLACWPVCCLGHFSLCEQSQSFLLWAGHQVIAGRSTEELRVGDTPLFCGLGQGNSGHVPVSWGSSQCLTGWVGGWGNGHGVLAALTAAWPDIGEAALGGGGGGCLLAVVQILMLWLPCRLKEGFFCVREGRNQRPLGSPAKQATASRSPSHLVAMLGNVI